MNQNDALDNVNRLKGLRLRYDAAIAVCDRLREDGNDAAATIAIAVDSMLNTVRAQLAGAACNLCHNVFARAALSDLLPDDELQDAMDAVGDDIAFLPQAYGRSDEVCIAAELGKSEDQLEVACFILQRAEHRLADAVAANS